MFSFNYLFTGCAPTKQALKIEGYDYEQKFGYDVLTDDEKVVYDALQNDIITKDKPFALPESVNNIDANNIIDLYLSQHQDDSWKETYKTYTCEYRGDNRCIIVNASVADKPSEKQLEKEKQLELATKEALEGIPKNASDYEKAKAIAVYLCDNITYNWDAISSNSVNFSKYSDEKLEVIHNCRNIYGALVDKTCVCTGYAVAFTYLCNKVGITSLNILGNFDSEGVIGAWNMVKMDDAWYHVNVKVMDWDDEGPDFNYFLVTDEQTLKDHSNFTLSHNFVSSRRYDLFETPKTPSANYEELIKSKNK